ncbi:hypothetical protein B0H19DRAFT_1115964 [Mycena capillaripes]|nr:hypothetical protein B0H19DRAFT_1115964 [Mycena capillaripes]
MGGSDLLKLLIERDVFDEGFTRFYVAEMILAIESCHKHRFIHRDIKPDICQQFIYLFSCPLTSIILIEFLVRSFWSHQTK